MRRDKFLQLPFSFANVPFQDIHGALMGIFGFLRLLKPSESDRMRRIRALSDLLDSVPTGPGISEAERVSRASWLLIERMGLPPVKYLMAWTRQGVLAPFPTEEHAKKYLLSRVRVVRDFLHPDILNGLGVLAFLAEERSSQTGESYQAELNKFAREVKNAAGQ
jgi:hypothetical protein